MSLPLVFGSQPAIGSLTRTVSTSTVVTRFHNASEQRGPGRMPLVNFAIPFNGIVKADKDAIRLAVAAAQGRAATNLAFVFNGITYTNLTLMKDEWQALEKSTGLYQAELQLRQTIPQALTSAGSLSVFPTLSAGVFQLPYGQGDTSQTDVNDSPSGMRYTWPWFGNGVLTGFPARELRKWPLSWSVLTDADLALIEKFFIGVNGKWLKFTFVDPDEFAVVTTSGTTATWISGLPQSQFNTAMVGTVGLSIAGTVYNVTAYTSTTQVTLSGSPGATNAQANFAYLNCRFGQDDLAVTHQRFNLSSIQSLVIEETN